MTKRWEYKIVEADNKMKFTGAAIRQSSETLLNKLGADGWDCYHIKTDSFPSVFYLKRVR